MTDKKLCGSPTADDEPCQHPATDGNSCWLAEHGGAADSSGRPALLADDRRQKLVFLAVGDGLKVHHQASMAGVSPDTLRRYACCIEDLSRPVLDDDACEFCESYAQAHARGARGVLDDCRPEFRASASFGYVKEEKREHEHTGGVEFWTESAQQDGDT